MAKLHARPSLQYRYEHYDPCTPDPRDGAAGIGWRKSSYCAAGECVEAASWRKSSLSGTGNCVEAGHGPGVVGIRDSALEQSPVLEFAPATWAAFTAALKAA